MSWPYWHGRAPELVRSTPSIVGMWVVGFYDSGNHPWDVGIEQFSYLGNEVMNDNTFPPSERNICWIALVSIGAGQYKLKHIGWSA